ncbi:Serine/threonine-protein kinase [Podosphaera aphanis]|nr:Serine/threonine-protein kinase [Podosphaera aphanis]
MDNDLSLSQTLGGLRIANPDNESLHGLSTEDTSTPQSAASKTTLEENRSKSHRISLFNLPFIRRGSPSDVQSNIQNVNLKDSDPNAEGGCESVKVTNQSQRAVPRKTQPSLNYRRSLSRNQQTLQDINPSHEPSELNSLRQHQFEGSPGSTWSSNHPFSATMTGDSSSNCTGIDSLRSSLTGTPTQTDPQANTRGLPKELFYKEQVYNQAQNIGSGPPQFGTGRHSSVIGVGYDVGSSNPTGTAPRYEMEGKIAPSSEDWKDKGAAVGVREEIDANGKVVLRQVKKGVRDFVFSKLLGEGSYSQVVLGTDRQTLKEYAVKILDKKHIIKEKKVKYVNIEKDTLNRLIEHPGIVRLFYTFQDSASLYYVLDIASGGELLGVLKKIGSFDEECTRFYGAQMLDAIEHMHNRGVIHRDLKPENVLMDDQMHIKITDFGTAKLLPDPRLASNSSDNHGIIDDDDESTRAKSFVGTAEYVSPELLTEKSACKASDLWAFGCIIYQLLSGRPPFKAVNDYQTFQKIVNLDYEYPPGFPPTAKDLVDRLLVLDPQRRLTIENIKSHPFFQGIQWGRGLWKQKAPRLKPYVAPPQEPNIIKLNGAYSSTASINTTRLQQIQASNGTFRPQPRVITELPPPTQLDIEWSPVLTRNNERILKLGNLIVLSCPVPSTTHFRHGESGESHEKKKISWFFGGSGIKKRQRLVMVTSSARLILAAPGGEEKKLKSEISLLAADCSWKAQVDGKGQEVLCVYTHGMHYTFEDLKGSAITRDAAKSSTQEWIDSLERAREIALSQNVMCDTGFDITSNASSSNGTLLSGSGYSEAVGVNERSSRNHLIKKSQTCIGGDEAESSGKKNRFSRRQSKSGLSIPF